MKADSRPAADPSLFAPRSRPILLHGALRFAAYLATQIAALTVPPEWLPVPAALILAAGMAEGLRWVAWLRSNAGLLAFAALPAVFGFPWESVRAFGTEAGILWSSWLPSLARSARIAFALASAAWLSRGMGAVDLRDAVAALLRPLGTAPAGRAGRAVSLAASFIPWTRSELRQVDEAARLRGSDPKVRPVRHLAAVAVPMMSRSLEKAARAADALSLRDPDFGS